MFQTYLNFPIEAHISLIINETQPTWHFIHCITKKSIEF